MKKFLVSAAIAAIAAVPFAGIAADDESDATIPASELSGGEIADVYVDVETGALWQESNGEAGLQTEADTGDNGFDADTRLTP